MKHYGIAVDRCILRCLPSGVPLIFTDLKMAEECCDEGEEVVELMFTIKNHVWKKERKAEE